MLQNGDTVGDLKKNPNSKQPKDLQMNIHKIEDRELYENAQNS